MKKLIAIIFVVLFANQVSAWEVFGLNDNTKLEDLEILKEEYLLADFNYWKYFIVPPKPVSIANQYSIIYSNEHGICEVSASVVEDKPYPYGTTVKSNIGELVYDDWNKLTAILNYKYNGKGTFYSGQDTIDYGFKFIALRTPPNRVKLTANLTYEIFNPKCKDGARKDALKQLENSIGATSDDF